jgi:DnaJ-class molecular chaperone
MKCPNCYGTGILPRFAHTIYTPQEKCPICLGTGDYAQKGANSADAEAAAYKQTIHLLYTDFKHLVSKAKDRILELDAKLPQGTAVLDFEVDITIRRVQKMWALRGECERLGIAY